MPRQISLLPAPEITKIRELVENSVLNDSCGIVCALNSASIASLQPENNQLSEKKLKSTCRRLHARCSKWLSQLEHYDQEKVWLRVKRYGAKQTPFHSDLPFFAQSLQKMRGLNKKSGGGGGDNCCCCFCGCSSGKTPVCQRCGGAGLRTVWMPLTAFDPSASGLVFAKDGSAFAYQLGEALVFDGDEKHQSTAILHKNAPVRISVDARLVNQQHLFGLERSVCPGRDRVWISSILKLIEHSTHLQTYESTNTKWFLELFGCHREVESSTHLCAAPSFRRAGCRRLSVEGGKDFLRTSFLANFDTGALVQTWMQAGSQHEVEELLKDAFRQFEPGSAIILTNKEKTFRVSDWVKILHAAHLVFLLTDWLAAPHRWANETLVPKKDKRKVWSYCIEAYNAIAHRYKNQNAELFMELAPIRALIPDLAVKRKRPGESQQHKAEVHNEDTDGHENVLKNVQLFAQQEDVFWDQLVCSEAKRKKKWRHKVDVELHVLLLRAWVCRLQL